MIVTIVALAVVALNCIVFFAPVIAYLTSEYFVTRRVVGKDLANEYLGRRMPNVPLLAVVIQNMLAILIVILRACGVSIQYLSGTIVTFAIVTMLFFITHFMKWHICLKHEVSVVMAIMLVAIWCVAI